MNSTEHLEIEHKFLVNAGFDLGEFKRRVRALKPSHETEVDVRDVYYVPMSRIPCVLRHRYDHELQQLTMKSIGSKDAEVRTEVNIDLSQAKGDQSTTIRAFLAPFEIIWSGGLSKRVTAFHLPRCEVVHYTAVADKDIDGAAVAVHCVEFEAVGCSSVAEAVEVIRSYESMLGFDAATRTKESLFEMILAPAIPAEVRKKIRVNI